MSSSRRKHGQGRREPMWTAEDVPVWLRGLGVRLGGRTRSSLASWLLMGRVIPCLFWHPQTSAAIAVHGDDFFAVGSNNSLAEVRATLEAKYKIKVEMLGKGPGRNQRFASSTKFLRHTEEGMEMEADPRHAEILIREPGQETAMAIKAPGAKDSKR